MGNTSYAYIEGLRGTAKRGRRVAEDESAETERSATSGLVSCCRVIAIYAVVSYVGAAVHASMMRRVSRRSAPFVGPDAATSTTWQQPLVQGEAAPA